MTNSNQSRVEVITATLRDEILRGQYREGERLPSERDLAARFEANRGAVREALKKLEQLGIASINPGGMRVLPIEEASLSILGPLLDLNEKPDASLIDHMLDVMGSMVSMEARTAIEQATDAEIQQMQKIVRRMVCIKTTTAENQENWKELGTLFTHVSNNLVVRLILNGLKTQFLERRAKSASPEIELDNQKSMQILKQLESSVVERNSKKAAEAITDHFLMVRQTIEATLRAIEIETPLGDKKELSK